MSKIPFYLTPAAIPSASNHIDVHILDAYKPTFTFEPLGHRRFDLVRVELGGHNVITTPLVGIYPRCNYIPMIDQMMAETDPRVKAIAEAHAKIEAAEEALAEAHTELRRAKAGR